jgi:hypothetical protein
MEYRVIANENPLGSRRYFENRVNLHLKFGWYPQGGPVAAGVQAQDWGQVRRGNRESLFVFQALCHGRGDAAGHLAGLAAEARTLLAQPDAERGEPERRRLLELLAYLEAEFEYHAELFPDKEAQEAGAEIPLSKERVKKALRPPV